MEITAITPQVKDKTRCNIETDGRFYCGMTLEAVVKNHLKAGMTITPERLSEIQLESEKATALDKALNFITVSMKSEKQIRDYLLGKGYLKDVCDYVVEKMKEYGYVDDASYALRFAAGAKKRMGKRLLALELKRRGISEGDAKEALLSVTEEEESAKEILMKYLRGKQWDAITLQKGYRYLIGKGFDFDVARSAVKSLGEADDED